MVVLNSKLHSFDEDQIGDEHFSENLETPLRDDAFLISDDEKINQIQEKFAEIMNILGLDLKDDSLKGTPKRVAKMFVKEIFSGLSPVNKPDLRVFENKYKYDKILVEKNIKVQSFCEHHFLPIVGKAHIGYIPNKKVVGLSKLNRVVDYFSRRPQVQERLTRQIHEELKEKLETNSVIVVIDAKHLCVSARGIQDISSSTQTLYYSGKFNDQKNREEFFKLISLSNQDFI